MTTVIVYYFCLLSFYLSIANINTISVIIIIFYYYYIEDNLQSFCPKIHNFVYCTIIHYCSSYKIIIIVMNVQIIAIYPNYDHNSIYEYRNGGNYHYHNNIDYYCYYDDDL